MKHLLNTRSGKYLCTVNSPKITNNVTDTGMLLSGQESVCEKCAIYFPKYKSERRKELLNSKSPLARYMAGAFK